MTTRSSPGCWPPPRPRTARAAPEAAIRLLTRALEEGAGTPPRGELLLALGRAELVVRDPACVAHLSEALELASDPARRAVVGVELASVLAAAGQWDAARSLILDGLREIDEEDVEPITDLEALRAALMTNDPELAPLFPAERARFEALAAGPSWSAHALAALLAAQVALSGEEPTGASDWAERALRDGVLIGERDAGSWAGTQVIMALAYTERYDRALEVAADIEREGRRGGSLIGLLGGPAYRGQVAHLRGDLRAAEADLRTVLDLANQTGMAMWSVSLFLMYLDALLEREELDDVVAMVEAFTLPPAFMASTSGGILAYSRGRLRVARGDREGGLADLRAAEEVLRPLGFGPNYFPWRSALALAQPVEDRDAAVALADEELGMARATGLPRALGVALRGRALLEPGAEGVALLEESVAALERSEATLERARSLAALGSALRRGRWRVEAREHLAAAMELAHRCGADRLTAHAHEELRAAGGRPRRVARSGADALTASELRVARLAAAGRANVEIAQELYVSVKTIETHLSHAYAKLGLSGQGARGRLATVLDVT